MSTRNLTRRFVEQRNAEKANRSLFVARHTDSEGSDSELLTNADSNSGFKSGKNSTGPPIWIAKLEQIEDDVAKVQTRMRDLGALHTKRLMVNFESDESKQEREIDLVTQEITELFRHAESILKEFSVSSDESISVTISASEGTMRNNMQRSMARKLQGLSGAFRSSQKEYMRRLQAQKTGGGAQAFEFLGENKKNSNIDMGFSTQQLQALDDFEEVVNERDEEITRIAKSVEDLAQIFKELAVLVIDQGTVLDRIDYNMEQAVDHAKEAIVQLEKAEEHQKSARSFRCIVVLIVLIAVMLLLFILKHTSFKKS
mmetsp:Transcript_18260/g.18329  ORF Transcript_18260/g.18329 Transcript_18260/m.18329 type:complete len:314 (+) Transcript_18260:266-1207(+)